MNIVAIAAARNEQDIIEAFVRHTLGFCGHLLLIDHGSTDDTPRILEELQKEGLAVRVLRDDRYGLLQTEHMARLLKIAAHELKADWIFTLDCDEFLQGEVLACLQEHHAPPEPHYLRVPLVNYAMRPTDDPGELNPVKRIIHRFDPKEQTNAWAFKSIVPGELARAEGAFMEEGNHRFTIEGFEPPAQEVESVWLAHFSLRSPCQHATRLVSRLYQKHHARSLRVGGYEYYETDYRLMRESYTRFSENFASLQINWMKHATSEPQPHPIDYRGGDLRYTKAEPDVDLFIRNTLDLGEQMAAISSSGKEAEAAQEELVATLLDAEGRATPQVRRHGCNTPAFAALRFELEAGATQVKIGFRGPKGVLEIAQAELHGAEGDPPRIVSVAQLYPLLSSDSEGVVVTGLGAVRILHSSLPMRLTLQGWARPGEPAPKALVLKSRFVSAPSEVMRAVFDRATLSGLHRRASLWGGGPGAPLCRWGEPILFTPSGGGFAFAGEGWSPQEGSGIALKSGAGRLHFRLEQPPTGAMQLHLRVACKPAGAEICVELDGVPTTVWKAGAAQKAAWQVLPIPVEVGARGGFEVALRVEGGGSLSLREAILRPVSFRDRLHAVLRGWGQRLAEALARPAMGHRIAWGEQVSFSPGGRGVWMLGAGWALPEAEGATSQAPVAELRLPLAEPPKGDLLARFLLRSGAGTPLVRLMLGTSEVGSWLLDGGEPTWVEARLPLKGYTEAALALAFSIEGGQMVLAQAELLRG